MRIHARWLALSLTLTACGGEWSSFDTPSVLGLQALWAFAPDDVWAGGDELLHYQGEGFEPVSYPSPSGFIMDFWGFAPNDLYAVTDARLLHYDGITWSVVDFGGAIDPSGLTAVWGSSKDDLWVGDSSNGQVHRFDGTVWRTTITQSVEVRDLWGSAPADVYAAGLFGVSRWDGTRWTKIDDDAISNGDGVFGFSASDVWLVGDTRTLAQWDGSSWRDRSEELDPELGSSHSKVWGRGPSDVWMVGDSGAITHWNGAEWSQLELDGFPALLAVHGSDAGDVWVAGRDPREGTGLIFHRAP